MNITIETLNIENLHVSHQSGQPAEIPPMARAFIAALVSGALAQDAPPADPPSTPEVSDVDGRPRIGEYWPDQGGIYAGDFRADDGTVYGLIVADCGEDVGRASWAPDGERDLSDWDGLDNTQRLRNECPAAKLANDFRADECADFYLPARRELMLAAANVPHLFGKESWYWTSTPRMASYAWAVDFENGYVTPNLRFLEFRVRPFRRFIY